jgi:hypothetical protein
MKPLCIWEQKKKETTQVSGITGPTTLNRKTSCAFVVLTAKFHWLSCTVGKMALKHQKECDMLHGV